MQITDMAGQTVGSWRVLRLAPPRRDHKAAWHVQCRCGARAVVTGRDLRRGASRQCAGCAQRAFRRPREPEAAPAPRSWGRTPAQLAADQRQRDRYREAQAALYAQEIRRRAKAAAADRVEEAREKAAARHAEGVSGAGAVSGPSGGRRGQQAAAGGVGDLVRAAKV